MRASGTRKALTIVLVAVAAAAAFAYAAQPTHAAITAYDEPPFTKPSSGGTNHWWFQSQVQNYPEKYCFYLYDGATKVRDSGCTENRGGTQTFWVSENALQEGHTYHMAVAASILIDGMWFPTQGPSEGNRTTTIDSTPPHHVSIALEGAKGSTNDASSIDVEIGYEDALSGPFPSTFSCIGVNEPCGTFTHDPGCSTPLAGANKSNSFRCSLDLSSLPDGRIYYCAREPDAARVDNPYGTNQGSAPNQANISDTACASVTLDRVAPKTTIKSGPAAKTTARMAGFRFVSSETGSRFQCKLDAAAWRACTSPKLLTGLRKGSHTFRVRAIDAAGNVDATPATRVWRVV